MKNILLKMVDIFELGSKEQFKKRINKIYHSNIIVVLFYTRINVYYSSLVYW